MRKFKSLLATVLVMFACGSVAAQDRPSIVAVNYPIQYFAQRLVDGAADVVYPVPQDADPSFWRPTIGDITMIQSADLILLNGAGFATWVNRVSLPRAKVVNTTAAIEDRFIVTESITHSHGDGGEHSHEGLASYTWLDPALAVLQAEAIAAAIIAHDLASQDVVEEQLALLRADLGDLDAQARAVLDGLQGIPMISTHPRYQYFERSYGLSMTSLEWEAGAAPSAVDIADLKAAVDETQARVLIWEAAPPAGGFDAAQELGLQNIVFSPLAHQIAGRGYLEAMSDAIAALSGIRQE